MDIPHFIYPSSVDKMFGLFHFLAIINSAAMNILMQVFIQIDVIISPRYVSRSGIAESSHNSMFNYLKN